MIMKKKYSHDEVDSIAKELWHYHDRCKVYTFTGPLGAGKTTLVRSILQQAGVKGVISSPTFTYVNAYTNLQGSTFYHFDLYRIADLNDFIANGFDECLYQQNSWSFIEWPELVMPLLKKRACHVTLDYSGKDERELLYETV